MWIDWLSLGVALAPFSIRAGRLARRLWLKRVSASWPAANAVALSGRVMESEGRYVLLAPYSFYAAGERYGGHYEERFDGEAEADEVLQRLHESPPLVRYKPSNPDLSVMDAAQ